MVMMIMMLLMNDYDDDDDYYHNDDDNDVDDLEPRRVDDSDVGAPGVPQELASAEGGHLGLGPARGCQSINHSSF